MIDAKEAERLFREYRKTGDKEIRNRLVENYIYVAEILAKKLGISPQQLSYVTQSGAGEGLLFYGNTIIPFIDRFPKDTKLYRLMTTIPQEVAGNE